MIDDPFENVRRCPWSPSSALDCRWYLIPNAKEIPDQRVDSDFGARQWPNAQDVANVKEAAAKMTAMAQEEVAKVNGTYDIPPVTQEMADRLDGWQPVKIHRIATGKALTGDSEYNSQTMWFRSRNNWEARYWNCVDNLDKTNVLVREQYDELKDVKEKLEASVTRVSDLMMARDRAEKELQIAWEERDIANLRANDWRKLCSIRNSQRRKTRVIASNIEGQLRTLKEFFDKKDHEAGDMGKDDDLIRRHQKKGAFVRGILDDEAEDANKSLEF